MWGYVPFYTKAIPVERINKNGCIFVNQERESLNSNIVHSINQASDDWGIRCLRYEIKDIHVPPRVKESMQMQVRTVTLGPVKWAGLP